MYLSTLNVEEEVEIKVNDVLVPCNINNIEKKIQKIQKIEKIEKINIAFKKKTIY